MGRSPVSEPGPTSDRTLEEACAELDLPVAFAQRFFIVALQLPAPESHQRVREDDLELLRIITTVFQAAGRDEDVGVAAGRYFGENLRRLAESQVRFFRETFEEPMFAMGMSQREAIDALVQVAAPLIPNGPPRRRAAVRAAPRALLDGGHRREPRDDDGARGAGAATR